MEEGAAMRCAAIAIAMHGRGKLKEHFTSSGSQAQRSEEGRIIMRAADACRSRSTKTYDVRLVE